MSDERLIFGNTLEVTATVSHKKMSSLRVIFVKTKVMSKCMDVESQQKVEIPILKDDCTYEDLYCKIKTIAIVAAGHSQVNIESSELTSDHDIREIGLDSMRLPLFCELLAKHLSVSWSVSDVLVEPTVDKLTLRLMREKYPHLLIGWKLRESLYASTSTQEENNSLHASGKISSREGIY